MQFTNNTLIAPDILADDIPVISGSDFYINNQGIICTYNNTEVTVIDSSGNNVTVSTIDQITDNIYIVNNYLAYRMSTFEILVTNIACEHQKYKGGFQGIVGFTYGDTTYDYINNTSVASEIQFTARLNNNKHLEINVGGKWFTPNGEFRCYINDTFYNISCKTILPNSFGNEFLIKLASWTHVTTLTDEDPTNYISDVLIQGNTLYLQLRKQVRGSTPYDWSSVAATTETVLYSNDSRFINCEMYGEPSGDVLFFVDRLSNVVYLLEASTLNYLNSYTHPFMITGVNLMDKQTLAIVDKRAFTVLYAYKQLQSYMMKVANHTEFNQMSAYEDLPNEYFNEQVVYNKDLQTIAIKSSYRQNMLCYILGNKTQSICHTTLDLITTDWNLYRLHSGKLFKYTFVEENAEYTDIYNSDGTLNIDESYEPCIYIGTDIEADNGGNTLADTEIMFEGKICIIDDTPEELGLKYIIESSGDKPVSEDLPVRTNQANPVNNWYLYSKRLRVPISYTSWCKIMLMPTTKIYSINLTNQSKVSKRRKK